MTLTRSLGFIFSLAAFILAFMLMAAAFAGAQATTTPGSPDTGLGGNAAMTLGLLAASGLGLLVGSVYLRKRLQ